MIAEKFTSDNYQKVTNLINSTQAQVLLELNKVFLYSKTEISTRIAQVLAMQLTEAILQKLNLNFLQKKRTENKISINNFNINFTNGTIKPSNLLIFKCTIKFLLLWGYVLFLFIVSFIKKNRKNKKVTLVHGVPASELSSDAKITQFELFCSNGPIKTLTESHNLIIQSTKNITRKRNSKFIYSRYPLLKAITYKLISLNDLQVFLNAHCKAFFNFFCLIYFSPISCILWSDFGLHSIAEFLDKNSIIQSNILTNTNWLNQFLWMTSLPKRKFKTFFALYSLNSSPYRFKGNPAFPTHPGIKYLRADFIYIWHKTYIKVLESEGINIKPIVVPPILWYLPQIYLEKKSDLIFKLCIFDITPMNEKGLKHFGVIENFCSQKNMKRFVDDILKATEQISRSHKEIKFEITLKHKKTGHTNFKSEYLDYVKDLSLNDSNCLKITDTEVNLFNLLASHDVAIVFPFSSPVFIADYLKVPSFFYDPTGDIVFNKNIFPKSVSFCNNRKSLKLMLENLIKPKITIRRSF